MGECRLFIALEVPPGSELLVKVLPAALSLAVDADVFEREVLLLAGRLKHPGLVAPSGAGRAGSFVYHTRRFVEGTTLRAALVRHGELPLRRAVGILRDVLAALAHAHAAGIVHGDLKPENVLLADAGIVNAVGRSLTGGAPDGDGPGGTASAALCATAYVAPERREGGAASGPRADMFAVGVLAHEMLTGRPPAAGSEPIDEVRSLPSWLGELVHRCLAEDPARRWADAAAALRTVSRPSGEMGGGAGGTV